MSDNAMRNKIALLILSCLVITLAVQGASPIKVLIIDGQNNHTWEETTPVLKQIYESSGKFQVDVATTPPKGDDNSDFKPNFSAYDVVFCNYVGDAWPEATNTAFEKYVREGGGLVMYHAADNAFPDWKEYNEMAAIGGWLGRTETAGPHVYWEDGKVQYDRSPGKAGSHGKRLPFLVVTRAPDHPIMKGLPKAWMHVADELYDSMRGPARNFQILATAYSDPANKGTGKDEPMLMTIDYGKGRVFHTLMGHDVAAIQCVGFITTLLRGTEWAATGKVTIKAPADFPNTMKTSSRE